MNDERSQRDRCILFGSEIQPDEVEELSRTELVSILSAIVQAARNVGFCGPVVTPEAEPNCITSFIEAELELRYPSDPARRDGRMFDADELIQGWVTEDVSRVLDGAGKSENDQYTAQLFSVEGSK